MDFIFRLLGLLILIADQLLRPIYWLRRFGKYKQLPKVDNQVFLFTATELAVKIRHKKLTSLYVVSSYIGRINQVNPILNAVTEDRFDEALIEAKAVDDFISQRKMSEEELEKYKPFFGVPITFKESVGTKGMSQAVGSLKRKGIKCKADSPTVHRLKAAGFIPLAVTNCPEYCFGLETNNLLIGATNNPYNTSCSVGGSSGGEAALISSAASVVGVGSDYAGSIRLPCMFTGIFGHKSTPKIIPRTMHFPDSTDKDSFTYFALGPMGRYATDLKPMLKIMCAEEGDCLQLDRKVDLQKVNVFYTEDYNELIGMDSISKDIVKCVRKARRYLKSEYAMNVKKMQFKELENAAEIGTSLFLDHTDRPNYLEDPENPKKTFNLYIELLKSACGRSTFSIYLLVVELMIRYNAFIPRSHLPYYKEKMAVLKKDIWETLGDNGVLLYPTFPSSAFQHYQSFTKSYGISYAMIFNIIGCPVTQVPIGRDDKGLPIGIQVVGAPKQDRLCLAVAEALEKGFGGWVPPN